MKKKTVMIVSVAALLFALVSVSNAAITITGAVSDTGGGYDSSDPWIIGGWGDLVVGDGGSGSLTINAGSEVHSTYSVISADGGVGEVTVTGAGSVWYGIEGLWMGQPGTLNISDGGLFKTNLDGTFEIGASSEVLIQTGGQMALLGADTTSLVTFLAKNTEYGGVNANLKYWTGSAWDSMGNGTLGTDYTLTAGTGDLLGYGVLTAIAPVTGGASGTVLIIQ